MVQITSGVLGPMLMLTWPGVKSPRVSWAFSEKVEMSGVVGTTVIIIIGMEMQVVSQPDLDVETIEHKTEIYRSNVGSPEGVRLHKGLKAGKFHNLMEFDRSHRKNQGGGGNLNSYTHNIDRHLKNPTHIVREKKDSVRSALSPHHLRQTAFQTRNLMKLDSEREQRRRSRMKASSTY